jgi:GWxTD domain-containing protein
MRKFLIAAAIATAAVSAFAQLSPQYAEWGKGPVQFIMTSAEQAQWKNVKTDAEASAFVDLFWARRDPTPATPQNEYKERFDTAVKYADERFTAGRTKGSMSDRGKILILFGAPTLPISSSRVGPSGGAGDDRGFGMNEGSASASGSSAAEKMARQAWTWEGEAAQKAFGAPRQQLDFVDQFNTGDYRLQKGKIDLAARQQAVVAASIVQPALTVAPKFGAAAAPAAAPAPAAPAVVATVPAAPAYPTTFKTPAYQTAVSDFEAAKTNPYKNLYVAWGEYVTPQGEYYVPVELYVPKAANLDPAADLTFFGVVESDGKPIAVFEEPAKLTVSKDDLYFDKTLMLPAGKHKGVFGLALNGKPVSMATTDLNLAGTLDKDAAAISALILSNNVYPLAAAQRPTDPFAFGGIKVVPKGDRTFHPSDELWYFFELRNPGLNEQNVPGVQVKLEMTGKTTEGQPVQMNAPPRSVEAQELKGVPGHYGVGSSIPLSSFKPGSYTLKVKVTDTVKKVSYNLSDDFKVVAEGK